MNHRVERHEGEASFGVGENAAATFDWLLRQSPCFLATDAIRDDLPHIAA